MALCETDRGFSLTELKVSLGNYDIIFCILDRYLLNYLSIRPFIDINALLLTNAIANAGF